MADCDYMSPVIRLLQKMKIPVPICLLLEVAGFFHQILQMLVVLCSVSDAVWLVRMAVESLWQASAVSMTWLVRLD